MARWPDGQMARWPVDEQQNFASAVPVSAPSALQSVSRT